MVTDLILGTFALVFGSIHLAWPRPVHRFYQRFMATRFISSSTVEAMRVHGALLVALGVVMVTVGLVRGS